MSKNIGKKKLHRKRYDASKLINEDPEFQKIVFNSLEAWFYELKSSLLNKEKIILAEKISAIIFYSGILAESFGIPDIKMKEALTAHAARMTNLYEIIYEKEKNNSA